MPDEVTPEPPTREPGWQPRPDLVGLAAGLLGVLWLPVSLWPDAGMPAWPSASLGVAALVLTRLPGAALPRGLGAFLGLIALLVGMAQIAAQWALVDVVPSGLP
jgi:hypothetical protein